MFASLGERSKQNGTTFLLATLLLLLLLFIAPSPSSTKSTNSTKKPEPFFPIIQVTIYNKLENQVMYTCGGMKNTDVGLLTLAARDQTTFNFSQIGFPLRWCYLYINDQRHGFFWAYAVRQRCSKCFWRIADHLYLYRSDRNRWERQSMYSPGLILKGLNKKKEM